MGILEKISEIEKEIARTQKNKGKIYFRLELTQVLILFPEHMQLIHF
jgi:ribosome-interacting GTPase 1